MLDDATVEQLKAYFLQHPVLGRHVNEVCVALTGSLAVGLDGRGADVDAKVLCPPAVYAAVKGELIATGRIGACDEPEEEFPDVVGDYTLESLATVWQAVQSYADTTPLFIYGNLTYILGNRALLDPLVSHCRSIPPDVLRLETERERASLDQALYGFLRSFQNADPVARMLARAGMVRSAMRLAFLAEGVAPPYDKHLFRLLPRLEQGAPMAGLIRRFLADSADADEATVYAQVGASEDWHAMYECAAETPAIRFRSALLSLL
jgi:hypothetical protein